MELGMIGLGRMGTNMVRRLLRADHQCVVYDLPVGSRNAPFCLDDGAGLCGRSDAGGATLMTTHLNTTAPAGRKPPWFNIVRFLVIVAMVVMFFLLAQSMVHHRFFRGGWVDRNGRLRP